jgi:hypothetical protein
MILVLTKNVHNPSDPDLRESQLAQEGADYSKGVPPQIPVGEIHLPRLKYMCHDLRRFQGDVILLQ